MRHFQLLLLALLAVISVELGLLVIRLPTPVAQAGPPNVPDPGYKGPTLNPNTYMTLSIHNDKMLEELAAIRKDQASLGQQVASLGQQVTAVGNQAGTILKYGHTWAWTCIWAGNLFGDLDPQRQKSIQGPKVSPCEIQTPVK